MNNHPRLLLNAAELAALQRRTRQGDGERLLAAVCRKVRDPARWILECPDLAACLRSAPIFWPKPGCEWLWGLHDMALAGRLAGDEDLLAAVRRVFLTLPELDARIGGATGGGEQYYIPPLFLPLAYDLTATDFSTTERERIADWMTVHYLRRPLEAHCGNYFKYAAHNMTVGAMEIALATALVLQGEPGMPELSRELDDLTLRFRATLNTAIGPDGYPEEDIGYGTVVIPCLAQIAEMLRRAKIYDAFGSSSRLRRFGRAMLHFVQPWGDFLSNTGDHGDQIRDREFVLARLAVENQDPALLWLLGHLTYAHSRTFVADRMPEFDREIELWPRFHVPATALALLVLPDLDKPLPPSKKRVPTAFCDQGRGIVSLRSGWRTDDTFVVFDGSQRSPAAPGHAHDSCGHFSLSALGEYFAIDGGRYDVEQSGHNVVLIDGCSGRDTGGQWVGDYHPGRLTAYRSDPFCDVAAVDSSHQHNCFWAWRTLGLVKGRAGSANGYVWVVDDINKANDWAEFWWTLNTSPENTIEVDADRATIQGWRQGNLLDVWVIPPDPASYRRPHQVTMRCDENWSSSHAYTSNPGACRMFDRPAEMLHGPVFKRPRLIANVSGYNGRFMTLMLPRKKNAPPPVVERLPTLDNALAVRIDFGDVEDILIYAYDHRLLQAADIKCEGNWCVVRRRRATGIICNAAFGDA